MKIFKIKKTKTSYKLFDDHEILVGEILFDYFLGRNRRVKINNKLYKVKYSGLLGHFLKFIDESGKLTVMIDSSKSRMFYYGDPYTEIYDFKTKGWWHSSTNLVDQRDDRLLIRLRHRNLFFTSEYDIAITENSFNNTIVVLAFLYYNIEAIEN
ncbi:MAG: hypothetical protein ACOVRK_06090 [Chryseobacterium taeanense]